MFKIKNILLIGYGSITKKHIKALNKLNFKKNIFILSNRKHKGKNFISKLDIKKINPDYIIVCSETHHHIKNLNLIEKNLTNKLILLEKPVCEKLYKLNKLKNKYFVNYQLRLHPIIQKAKKVFKNKKILNLQVICNSFLPDWRKRNYSKIYSSDRNKGGGVLLDLSHEIDYILWIFDKIKIQHFKINKISKLKIDSEDFASLSGSVSGKGNLQLSLSYFSRINSRSISVDSDKESFYGDLAKNYLKFKNNKKEIVKYFQIKQSTLLYNVHKKIIKGKFKDLCTLKEGISVLKFIEKLKKFKMFNFRIIKHKDVIILDDGFSNIKFKNFSYETVNLKTINIFCALKTIFSFLLKSQKLSLKEIYKQNLYRMYSPKLAISHHINKKAVECKYLCPEIRNAIYQFAYFRNKKKLTLDNLLGKFKDKNKNINENLIDYLFVFHERDKKNFNFKNTQIFVVGSVKNNEIILKKKNKQKKSILFISEYNPKFYKQNKLSYKRECKLFKFLYEFCKKNKIKLNIALRSNRNDKNIDKKAEIKFYNKFFGQILIFHLKMLIIFPQNQSCSVH